MLNMQKKGVLSFVMISKRNDFICRPIRIILNQSCLSESELGKWNYQSENIKKAAVITESLKIPLFSIAIDGGTIQESNIGNFNLSPSSI